ncbi:unnamed protein product [Symbiodinium sp. CCMP2456]|nr:unnamed protein product [Symbiodinium sp. CCMP2456]
MSGLRRAGEDANPFGSKFRDTSGGYDAGNGQRTYTKPSYTLFVTGIPDAESSDSVEEVFALDKGFLQCRPVGHKSRRMVFVDYDAIEHATRAMQAHQGFKWEDVDDGLKIDYDQDARSKRNTALDQGIYDKFYPIGARTAKLESESELFARLREQSEQPTSLSVRKSILKNSKTGSKAFKAAFQVKAKDSTPASEEAEQSEPPQAPESSLASLASYASDRAGKGLAPGQRVPSHRYLYFMPPGQPGEKRLAMYPAMWLRQLTTSRWVPGTEGGTGAAPKRGWFKPCEVLLKSDASKPGLPVADLPPDVVRGLGEAFKTLFAWGTVAPEAPVERLEAVGAAARNQAGSEAPEPLWRAVCNAHRLGTLKPVQRQKLKQLASLPVFPAPPDLLDGADRLALSRLVRPAAGTGSNSEATPGGRHGAMYIGPWQEYKLARLIQHQHQVLAAETREVRGGSQQASPSSSRSGFSGFSSCSAPAQLPGQPSVQVRLNDYCDTVERLTKANDRRPPRPRLPSGSSTGSTRPYSSSSRNSEKGPGLGSSSSASSVGASKRRAPGKPPKAVSFEEQRRARIRHMQKLYGLGQAETDTKDTASASLVIEPQSQRRGRKSTDFEGSPGQNQPSEPTSPKSEEWTLPTVKEADPLSLSMGSSGGLIAWSKGLQPDALYKMDVQTPVKKKRSQDYLAETTEKAPRPAATKIEEGGDKKQVINEKDVAVDPRGEELLELQLQVIDEEHFFELDGNLYKVMDPKALVEVSHVRPKKQANAEQRKLSGFKQWYANRKWLVDVRSPDWPLRDVVDDVAALVDFSPTPSKACMEGLVSWCCSAEPESLSEELRTAFSHAMAALVDEASKSPLPPPEALKKLLPDLKLFCKEGPGLGRGRFPARWLPAFAAGPGGVVPVLNDDSAKAAMLTPAQSLQLLGVGLSELAHF